MNIGDINLVGCCAIYCGLCTKFQSAAKSRCIGCRLGEQRSWCSIWRCCVKKHGFETCAECDEYPCERYQRRWSKCSEGWRIQRQNLDRIMQGGIDNWLKEQRERQALAEELLQNYNEGRSMRFYCDACKRMPIDLVYKAIEEAKKRMLRSEVENFDIKSKAKIIKGVIKDLALSSDINLNLL